MGSLVALGMKEFFQQALVGQRVLEEVELLVEEVLLGLEEFLLRQKQTLLMDQVIELYFQL